ncbi:MAG TPA: formate dehydrogenase accessory sulfurtransferase FdhD [Granulicella sp.]|jgi:FdhD protein|nr:formate dehydrogenase accessory sulfurtransferase FdhD [Granulicella sp.]
MGTESELLADVKAPEGLGDRTTAEVSVRRFFGAEAQPASDLLAVEEPLELQLMYGPAKDRRVKSISVTMRTPGNDFELVAGFLLTEGIVSDLDQIRHIGYVVGRSSQSGQVRDGDEAVDVHDGGEPLPSNTVLPYQPERNVVRVELADDVTVSLSNLERNFYTTSSCGICGKASLLALRTVCPPRSVNRFRVDAELLYSLPEKLRAAQNVFERTGGLHASGLFDAAGNLHAIREDVGRHNAVDKLLGSEFLADRTPLRDGLLLLSGRVSFELLQKALMGGIPMVVAVGAPSSLAVQVAKEFDISLVGFLRKDHFNVYHGADRVLGRSGATKETI